MLTILRQMSLAELREAAAACGVDVDASPEAILRALCRECGVVGWGFVPLSREDALLEQAAQRLGITDAPHGPRRVPALERRVFATLLRRAWEAAGPETQRAVLREAERSREADAATLPALPEGTDPERMAAALGDYLRHPAGLRALGAATAVVPLRYPPAREAPLAEQISAAVGNLVGVRLPPGARPTGRGYAALFGVLKTCWRARHRLLRERRAQQQHLEQQALQLMSAIEQRAGELRGKTTPWSQQCARGSAVAAGAAAALIAQAAMTNGFLNVWGLLVALGGAGWTLLAVARRPRVASDPRYGRLHTELAAVRQQLQATQTSIGALEGS